MPQASAESGLGPAGIPEGLVLHAGERPLAELLSVAAEAARSSRRVRLTGVGSRSVEDLMRIAVAGGDCVDFASFAEADGTPARTPPRRWFFRRR